MGLFGRKKKNALHKEAAVRNGAARNDQSTHESSMNTDYAVHMQSRMASGRFHVNEEGNLVDNEAKKKGVGSLVKKLNCAAPKTKDQTMESMMYVPSARRKGSTKGPWGWGNEIREQEITRPVLVTIKDGDMPYVTPANEEGTIELKKSFVIGKRSEKAMPRSPQRARSAHGGDSMFRMSMGDESGGHHPYYSSPRNSYPAAATTGPRGHYGPRSKDTQNFMSQRELSRQQRWKRGLKKAWREDADVTRSSRQANDHEDESAFFACSGMSVATGNSGYTGYTTDVTEESEDSDDYLPPHRGGGRRQYSNSPHHARGHPSRAANSNSLRNGPGLWEGVAEDMGIIAGMLLSDGAACFSGVADITKETVTSCRADPY